MFQALYERMRQKRRTVGFPKAEPVLPDRFRGRPRLAPERCAPQCERCARICPTGAIQITPQGLRLDMGLCLFCGACAEACPTGAITFIDANWTGIDKMKAWADKLGNQAAA